MAALTEVFGSGAALVTEADDYYCREEITVLSGQNLIANTILGLVARGLATSAAKTGGNTGNGVMGAVTVSAALAKAGVYQLRITVPGTNAGHFRITDPDGRELGEGDVAVAFSANGLAFTLADGTTDFILGDGFDITVAAGSGKYVAIDFAGTTGSEDAAGMLIGATDASAADAKGTAIVRGPAALNGNEIVWPTGASSGQKNAAIAQLALLGILVRF